MRKVSQVSRVTVLRDIVRKEGPYAKAGEQGEVLETFQPQGGSKSAWFAKVQMGGMIKTFRVTSLAVQEET